MHQRRNSGFTLIELLLAMSFVSMLLILILSVTLAVTRIYNKGITLKAVNQSGAAIGSDLQTTMKAADAPLTSTILAKVANGRLCLGTYSYIWNEKGVLTNKYSGVDSSTPIGLVKVNDTTGKYCASNMDVTKSDARELLLSAPGTTNAPLQIRDFSVGEVAHSGIDYVYNVTYTISTADPDPLHPLIAATTAGGDACVGGPGDEFCALNQFTFDIFMRTGGSGKMP